MKKLLGIKDFYKYLTNKEVNNDEFCIINYSDFNNIRLKSCDITINFYLLAIKQKIDIDKRQFLENQGQSLLYIDYPMKTINWDIEKPDKGFTILISSKLINKLLKEYNFSNYNEHEGLYLTKEEEIILWDIFEKTNKTFLKTNYSKDIIMSYISLILSYVQVFYNRQFDSRKNTYNKIVENFYNDLKLYFKSEKNTISLPSVTYFAEKSHLSTNYFGDLIKHFTGESPIEHIHNAVLEHAKSKLKNTSLSISEISYSLGFDYPNYFSRFFKKKTGVSPKDYRNII